MYKKYLLLIICAITLSACNFNSSIMLRADKKFQYTAKPLSESSPEYRISPNDILEFRIFTNDGFKLIDLTSMTDFGGQGNAINGSMYVQQYLVENDGMIKLPIIGRVDVKGLTIRETELLLEKLYSESYIKPFVIMKVINRRVIVFPGMPGNAKVIPLLNNNTTLIEALALAGGISENGRAKKIKIIRGDLKNPEIYLVDLSTIEGIKHADLILQANDIIYVEPRLKLTQGIASEIVPIVSLLSSIFVLTIFTRQLK